MGFACRDNKETRWRPAHVCKSSFAELDNEIRLFSLSRLDETLDAFAGATIFSNLNLAITYHEAIVKPSEV